MTRRPNAAGILMIEHGKKLFRIVAGSLLVVLGIGLSLPGIPGPGIAVVILGLSVLSTDFEFARRWLDRLKAGVHRVLERRRNRGIVT